MDREIALDKFLKHICENSRSFWTCNDYLKEHLNIDDYNLSTSIANEIIDRGWAKPSNYSNDTMMVSYEGQQVIENYSSYSSFLQSEKVAQKKAQRSITTADFIKIGIAIIFGLSTPVLGWLNYNDSQKIDKLETETEKANHINDSLILQNDKYRNHLQRKETQDSSLRN
jgi:hypothetical protein